MGISIYSVIVSTVIYNICLIAITLLRRKGLIHAKYVSGLILFMTLLAALRMIIPLDLDQALVLRSLLLLPVLKRAFTEPLWGSVSVGRLILMAWGAGALFFATRDLVTQLRFHLEMRRMLPVREERVERIAAEYPGRYRIKVSPGISLPFVEGLFMPTIYLPAITLSDEDWRNIFRHETQHIRSHDEWKKLIFRLMRSLFWWNPLARTSEEDISLLIELQCDDRVVGSGDFARQESYLRTMMTLMRRHIGTKEPILASPMIARQTQMELRFAALLAPAPKHGKLLQRWGRPLLLALFLASYFVIWQPAGFPAEQDILDAPPGFVAVDITPDVTNTENSFILYKDGEYKLYIDGEYVCCLDDQFLDSPDFKHIPVIKGE